jgi:hypothetical protein
MIVTSEMPPMCMLEVLLQFQHASSQSSAAKHINFFFDTSSVQANEGQLHFPGT